MMTTDEQTTTPVPVPYRVVDREGEGWLSHPGDPERGTYYDTYPNRALGELSYEHLLADRGPLRPVGSAPEESDAIVAALIGAGPKAVATLLSALHEVALAIMARTGRLSALVAGRPGSWESSDLRSTIVWAGEGIKPARTDPAAVAVVRDILLRWTLDGDVAVEVAESMTDILAEVIPAVGGWQKAADRWLRSGSDAVVLEKWATARIY